MFYTQHYGCPETPPGKRRACGSIADYFCKAWGCETLALGWTPGAGSDPHIRVYRDQRRKPQQGGNPECARNNCNPTIVTVLNPRDPEWLKGRTWGLKLYVSGADPGTFFTVRRLPTQGLPMLRGRGEGGGLSSLRPPSPPLTATPTTAGKAPTPGNYPSPTPGDYPSNGTGAGERPSLGSPIEGELQPSFQEVGISLDKPHHQGGHVLELLEKSFTFFNSTQPDFTESCWLCLSPRPPYYVGVGVNATRQGDLAPTSVNLTGPPSSQEKSKVAECLSGGTITLAEFYGKGTCYLLGNYSLQGSNFSSYCLTEEIVLSPPHQLTVTKAPEGVWFICTEGIFKCIVPTSSPELCVSAYIIPQVYLYGGHPDFLPSIAGPELRRAKRAPLLIPIIATLGVVGAVGLGAGALVHGDASLRQLSLDFAKDVSLLQDQVAYLEKQVDSLAEVALQNRRGLDLLFLQQGGLCAALGEECCLYANHSGIIRENIKVLTKRLKDREKEGESANWYASLFKTSPWLTTLLSAVTGPLLIILVALILGPIILNKLLAFIRERIATVKLMVLSQPYTALPLEDNEVRSKI